MVRWRSGLRRSLAVSALCLLGGALVALPTGASGASNAELVVDYSCTGGIALGTSVVNLRTKVSIPTTLTVGEPLSIGWALNYKNNDPARFGSPGYFGPGGKVFVTGNVQLSGSWVGELQPKGFVEQPGKLQPGKILKLPDGISDSAHTDRAGTLKVSPRKLFVDFMPPAGEVVVNNDEKDDNGNFRVGYHGAGDWYELNDEPLSIGDHGRDLHRTDRVNSFAEFTFTGTGIEYIARRSTEAGKVGFKIDGFDATPSFVDASKNADGTPTNAAHQGGLTLWRFNGLQYGEHTIKVTNLEGGKFAQVDAFRVITKELKNPPDEYRATCTLVSAPGWVNVTISEPGASPPVSPSASPSVSPSASPSASPSVSPSASPSVSPSASPSSNGNQNGDQSGGTNSTTRSTTTSTPKPTLTVTATVTPTRPTPTAPQVIITPSGGAQTGEAPQGGSGLGLLGAGTAMVTGSALGGVVLMRRRAAHARGQRDS
ncbi:hypothetical protein AB0F88_07025 [Streptosporangium sp. NPDC023963]|uniref:hypothetical protein n=1 Tax=Streptosporangium sp. NPDC023963 TaxID=3155608 RepID=UPI0034365BA3